MRQCEWQLPSCRSFLLLIHQWLVTIFRFVWTPTSASFARERTTHRIVGPRRLQHRLQYPPTCINEPIIHLKQRQIRLASDLSLLVLCWIWMLKKNEIIVLKKFWLTLCKEAEGHLRAFQWVHSPGMFKLMNFSLKCSSMHNYRRQSLS